MGTRRTTKKFPKRAGALRVLVVDDNRELRSCIREVLQLFDVDVDTAGDGIRAAQLASQINYDVVVCDIRLPGQDGFAVLDKMNRLRTRPRTILITAYPEWKVYKEMRKMEADEIMLKPLDLRELALRVLSLSGRGNGKHA